MDTQSKTWQESVANAMDAQAQTVAELVTQLYRCQGIFERGSELDKLTQEGISQFSMYVENQHNEADTVRQAAKEIENEIPFSDRPHTSRRTATEAGQRLLTR